MGECVYMYWHDVHSRGVKVVSCTSQFTNISALANIFQILRTRIFLQHLGPEPWQAAKR